MHTHLEKLNWRYATKRFQDKKLPKETLQHLKEAVRLSASSYGLQPYKVLIIEDEAIREKLKIAAFNQPQITEASQLIVFASFREMKEENIDSHIENIVQTRKLNAEILVEFAQTMKDVLLPQPTTAQAVWASKQTYIGLGFLLNAAAHLGIDACPMEGFDKAELDRILNLEEKGLASSVIATVGYRSEEDPTQSEAKVRKPESDFFITI